MAYMKDEDGRRLDTFPVADRRGLAPTLRAVLLGDSITANNGAGTYANPGESSIYNDNRGWFHWANAFLGRPFTLVRNAGKGGDRTDQMLARYATDVLPYAGNGTWLFGMAGVNDKNVIGGAALTPTQTIANLEEIFDRSFKAGVERIVWGTVFPDSNTLVGRAGFDQINRWLAAYAASHANFVLINWLEIFTDGAADGNIRSQYSSDGLHPNSLGAMKLGQYLADAIGSLVPKMSSLPMRNVADGVFGNPMLIGDSGGTGKATGFTATNFSTYKMPRWDGRAGEWQVLNSASAAAEALFYASMPISDGKFALGDRVYSEVEIETEDDWSSVSIFSVELFASGDASVNAGVFQAFDMLNRNPTQGGVGVGQVLGNPGRVVLRTPILTVPAGVGTTGQLRQVLHFKGIGTIRVARFGTYKEVTA